jgi:endonuclease YncB( thermonuclease family)
VISDVIKGQIVAKQTYSVRIRSLILLVLLVPLAFLGAAWLMVQPCLAADFNGKVVGIIDGDTIEVLHNDNAERIRSSGIECPEKGPAYGNNAKHAASDLAFGKEVTVQTNGHDKYKRIIENAILPDGININHTLVKEEGVWITLVNRPTNRHAVLTGVNGGQ